MHQNIYLFIHLIITDQNITQSKWFCGW